MIALIRILVPLAVLMLSSASAWSQAQPACPALAFTLEKPTGAVSFDVATLRKERQELYAILERPIVQDLYYGDDMKRMVAMLHASYAAWRPDEKGIPGKAEIQRATKFFIFEALKALETLKLECGSIMDALVAELSLTFTKNESEHLARIVTDPINEKFLVFLLRMRSQHKIPVQIRDNINASIIPRINTDLREKCKQQGVAPITCEKVQLKPLPG